MRSLALSPIILWVPLIFFTIVAPVAVSFCFDDSSVPDIFSEKGLQMVPLRIDTRGEKE